MGYLDRFALEGKVALVSGGGGAIGSAIAGALAAAGAKVSVVDVTQERAAEAAARVGEGGAEVLALAADVTTEADCDRIVAATVERFGQLDIIVNCVGGGAGKVGSHAVAARDRACHDQAVGEGHQHHRPEQGDRHIGRHADEREPDRVPLQRLRSMK